jgi:phosphoenolpyruvate carboxykinase (ATP)
MSAPTDILANEHQDLSPAALIERALLTQEGQLTSSGALAVETGMRTERYPLDRFIVNEPSTSDTIDWGEINQPFPSRQFDELWSRVSNYLAERDTYTSELHVGQDLEYYLPIYLKTETAWHNLVGQTLFIRPDAFNPKSKEVWSILHAANFDCDPQRDGTRSEFTAGAIALGITVEVGGVED